MQHPQMGWELGSIKKMNRIPLSKSQHALLLEEQASISSWVVDRLDMHVYSEKTEAEA